MALPSKELPIELHLVRVPLRVRFCETDLMGIVHHANYLQYFEVGRVEWLKSRGVSYERWVERGVHLPVVEAKLRYRKAARFDDELMIETSVVTLTRLTVRFGYRILRPSPEGEALLCEGDTLLACVGADLAVKRLPPEVIEVLNGASTADSWPAQSIGTL
jgi:acyl-CoA thioester hydrolase